MSHAMQVLLNYRAMYSFNLMYRDNLLLRLLTNTAVIYQLLFYSAWDPDEVTYYYTTGECVLLCSASALPCLERFRGLYLFIASLASLSMR